MIELDDFIAEAMTSIVKGIQTAQQSNEFGAYIAPLIQGEKRNDYGNFHLKDDTSNQATIIQFDVQVATEILTETKVDGKSKFRLYVVDIEVGGGGKGADKSSHLHRLQFAIPIKIPRKLTNANV